MKTLKTLESKQHGTPDFPFGYYRVDKNHPSFHIPFHWHTEFEILLVRSGRFSLTLNNETKRPPCNGITRRYNIKITLLIRTHPELRQIYLFYLNSFYVIENLLFLYLLE